jgi:PPOX class probable F420-dependent enzyme
VNPGRTAGPQGSRSVDSRLMDRTVARRRVADARVGRLATLTPEARPHVVPCCFVLDDETVYSAVDAKPKSTLALRRLENLRAHPSCSLLVDHYAEEWADLWWVRVDGSGRVIEGGDERERALDLLKSKYRQYREAVPPGAVVALDIERWRMWP